MINVRKFVSVVLIHLTISDETCFDMFKVVQAKYDIMRCRHCMYNLARIMYNIARINIIQLHRAPALKDSPVSQWPTCSSSKISSNPVEMDTSLKIINRN